ncbi:MAG: HAD hydrolase-like protein [Deltaproteobacteria bacterium]|nr:HAD hydrolase-like protein [Deltaproteobacteria bacterium]
MFIAFDLDGTLADPSEGVTNGINHTLKQFGKPERPRKDLLKYIGPPTEWIFADVLQTADPLQIEAARAVFTDFYKIHGYRQNMLYPDSLKIIGALTSQGHYLVVVTSKSDSGAKAAARHFQLYRYFKNVFGRVNDCSKIDSLNLALSTTEIRPAVMIGDRKYDIEAGKACGCMTIGVTYGFGAEDELRQSSPDYITDTQEGILNVIQHMAQSL